MGSLPRSLALFLAVPLVACGSENYNAVSDDDGSGDDDAPGGDTDPSPTGDAERAILEADIIQVDGDLLYAMSESGTLSIIDISVGLTMLGQHELPGRPFEMYRRGDYLVTMSNRAVDGTGTPQYEQPTANAGALVLAVDVSVPSAIRTGASFTVPGHIADSRVVGDVLYLATYENTYCYGCGALPRTMVTSFDIADPLQLRPVDQEAFESNAPDGYNLPWGQNWTRSIIVTDERLYIGGHADIDPGQFGTTQEGIIDVIDITDPTGRMRRGARINVAGAILSRWQVDERNGILRVVSQMGAGRSGNGLAYPQVQTFRIESTDRFTPLGTMTLQLPYQEGLRTVRFDDDRAYAITYFQTDPMFVIDLSNPAQPRQRGELWMPGFMYHLEPHGDRVLGLGIDRTDPMGNLNVSLFDVSNPDVPLMLSRASFGPTGINEDFNILNSEVPEDQDRIHKAFRVLDNGLVVVPFSAPLPYWQTTDTGTVCANVGGGVQLVTWQGDALQRRALLPIPGNPRRGLEHDGDLVAISDSNARRFDLTQLDSAQATADVSIGTCVPRDPWGDDWGEPDWGDDGGDDWDDGEDWDEGDDDYYGPELACSAGRSSGGATFALLVLALAFVRRRRR